MQHMDSLYLVGGGIKRIFCKPKTNSNVVLVRFSPSKLSQLKAVTYPPKERGDLSDYNGQESLCAKTSHTVS